MPIRPQWQLSTSPPYLQNIPLKRANFDMFGDMHLSVFCASLVLYGEQITSVCKPLFIDGSFALIESGGKHYLSKNASGVTSIACPLQHPGAMKISYRWRDWGLRDGTQHQQCPFISHFLRPVLCDKKFLVTLPWTDDHWNKIEMD